LARSAIDGNFTRPTLSIISVSISVRRAVREVFEFVGGFDAAAFRNKLYDADFLFATALENIESFYAIR